MIMEDLKITILAFNIGYVNHVSGRAVNGPGISLYNFIKILKKENPLIKIDLFTHSGLNEFSKVTSTYSILSKDKVLRSIQSSRILHHWSGIGKLYSKYIKYAETLGKKVLVGPNVLDGVSANRERQYLKNINPSLFLTINTKLEWHHQSKLV